MTVRRRSFAHLFASLAAFVLLAAACLPAAGASGFATPAAQAVERAASEAFHRMELGRLATGSYTTNVLVDVDLPPGTRLTLEAFDGDGYLLRVTADDLPDLAWFVTPRGVRRALVR